MTRSGMLLLNVVSTHFDVCVGTLVLLMGSPQLKFLCNCRAGEPLRVRTSGASSVKSLKVCGCLLEGHSRVSKIT